MASTYKFAHCANLDFLLSLLFYTFFNNFCMKIKPIILWLKKSSQNWALHNCAKFFPVSNAFYQKLTWFGITVYNFKIFCTFFYLFSAFLSKTSIFSLLLLITKSLLFCFSKRATRIIKNLFFEKILIFLWWVWSYVISEYSSEKILFMGSWCKTYWTFQCKTLSRKSLVWNKKKSYTKKYTTANM